MNELTKRYQEKQNILIDLKRMYKSDKKDFKENFIKLSIIDRANVMAFLLMNDKKFYFKVKKLIG